MNTANMELTREYRSILSLPLEILEFVLSMLPFHRDLPNARLVCRNWYNAATTIMYRSRGKFIDCLGNGTLVWSHMESRVTTPPGEIISPRYSHAVCYFDGFMYIFGGTTLDKTYFNDVIKFDLAKSRWSRLTSKNACSPLPKCGASLVVYSQQLIVYGGQSRTIQGIQQEVPRFHKELHLFDLKSEDWVQITNSSTPTRAAHQASLLGDKMVVTCGSDLLHRICNDVWLLNLLTFDWIQVSTTGLKPPKRAYHSQVVLSERHVLVLGGLGERNEPLVDIWLLALLDEGEGFWTPLRIESPENAPPRSLGQAICQVDKKMVALGKITRPLKPLKQKQKCAFCLRQLRQPRRDLPLQFLPLPARFEQEASNMSLPARFRSNSRNNRDRLRNEVLNFHLERFRMATENSSFQQRTAGLNQPDSSQNECTCPVDIDEKFQNIHVLDISNALDKQCVTWQEVMRTSQRRSDAGNLSFYSIVGCIDRIALFGGVSTLAHEETVGGSAPTTNQLSFLSFRECSP